MSTVIDLDPANDRELVIGRILDAPREALYRCWTEPKLITQWFTPPPWKTVEALMDVRPGGSSLIVMEGPDGTRMPNPGVFLDVAPNERLVFTDAFTQAWVPAGQAFMVATLTFEDAGEGKTRYVARIAHWTAEAKAQHEAMGFHAGWGVSTDQLEALAKTL
ncbi:SRPBCC family protein [soil metagenome]